MHKKNIRSILQEALEEEIPSSEVNLMPLVKVSLVSGKHGFNQQGEKMNTKQSHTILHSAFVVIVLIALLTVTFITPQGRAFAQNILQFFRRADGQVLPLPSEQIVSSPELLPAPLMSTTNAEIIAGFDAKELTLIPQGFNFIGVVADKGLVSIQYEAISGGGALVINESTKGFMQSEWDQAPAEYISAVKIGSLDAEIVQGTYVVYPDDTSVRWNPDAPILRLRWIEDGIWFEMAKFGNVESIAYLDQTELIILAENLK